MTFKQAKATWNIMNSMPTEHFFSTPTSSTQESKGFNHKRKLPQHPNQIVLINKDNHDNNEYAALFVTPSYSHRVDDSNSNDDDDDGSDDDSCHTTASSSRSLASSKRRRTKEPRMLSSDHPSTSYSCPPAHLHPCYRNHPYSTNHMRNYFQRKYRMKN